MSGSPGSGGVVRILGTHGVPAAYGGFETAAQNVGLYLRDRGWRVIVYCQEEGPGGVSYDEWRGLERVRIQEPRPGWRGTAAFDLSSVRHVLAHATPGEVCLTFGYNTGVFNVAQRLRGIPNVINMDGMEWTRRRWGVARQAILLGNERFAGLFGDVLIGDHPEISAYLRRNFGARRVRTIAYGGHAVVGAPEAPVTGLGLEPGGYAVVICRPIPENSVLEIVQAWAARERAVRLVVLGDFSTADPYHQRVLGAANWSVMFPGAIYDEATVQALRYHAVLYLHGHTVGGTNPSLVESMAAGNAVVAHDNAYNRWVVGDGARFFGGAADLDATLTELLDDESQRRRLARAAFARFQAEFTWDHIGGQYEETLLSAAARAGRQRTNGLRGKAHAVVGSH